jgi:hypothetical protein
MYVSSDVLTVSLGSTPPLLQSSFAVNVLPICLHDNQQDDECLAVSNMKHAMKERRSMHDK